MRNGELEITQELISILLSAVDSLNNMLTSEKEDKPHDTTIVDNVSGQLERISTPDSGQATANKPAPEQKNKTEVNRDEGPEQRWRIGFYPDERLFYTGNDPLRLIRELKSMGEFAIKAEVDNVPDFDKLDVHNCHLGWRIQVQGHISQEQVEEVFAWVEGDCRLEIHHETERRKTTDRRQAV